eukprot:TRINITY_DN19946_c0_g1_i1.p1 TRINITY_DN19946_c0_g1~~TRINITY_DN19946_c0_g1_i1.p1  ORF type:complete len:124 (-),score=24.26 TRINITY_DN19946_c0_g1_i1:39-410(-)
MAFQHPAASTSAVLSLILFVITLSGVQILAPTLSSSNPMTLVGGFLSSFVFIFFLFFIGNLERETGWPEVLLGLFITAGSAALIHPVCVSTSILFSLGELYFLNQYSKALHTAPAASSAVKRR